MRSRSTEADPVAFTAVTVCTVDLPGVVGVPAMAPVAASRVSPAGRAGETSNRSTGPPSKVGTSGGSTGTPTQ